MAQQTAKNTMLKPLGNRVVAKRLEQERLLKEESSFLILLKRNKSQPKLWP